MEVLGAVAAAGQLVGTAVKILELIAELREFLKNAHGKCQGWLTQLTALDNAITDIRLNPTLHTSNILHIIEAMYPKVRDLGTLLPRYSPVSSPGLKIRFTTRMRGALSARTVEARIIQLFQSLEHDKTTLILTITTLNRSIARGSYAKMEQGKPVKEDTHTTTQEISSPNGPSHDIQMNQGRSGQEQNNHPAEADQTVQSPSITSPKRGTHIENLDINGNGWILANSTERDMMMKDVKGNGHGTFAGAHDPQVMISLFNSGLMNNYATRDSPTGPNGQNGQSGTNNTNSIPLATPTSMPIAMAPATPPVTPPVTPPY
ncbi:uncharacterized protein F4817DRAFT_348263 [Daldinia loculata]|uniref:uncharacterized protein n=1 Tax=Daldinia loculata TaxID=103429 RepID=UPI0020C4B5DA|nr:uncharacterized protein F4817DRAFT_348263 [Daldinia loculata]KAI1643906.1 hypothetical protein F4817DRAFT_348263 [Daldinia loculata]